MNYSGAHDWEHYQLTNTFDDGHFLIAANYFDGNSYEPRCVKLGCSSMNEMNEILMTKKLENLIT